jgi:hypothetical protein
MNFRQKKFGLNGSDMLWIGPPPFSFPALQVMTYFCNCF